MSRGLVVDLFAGGGGASTGIELALGRSPDVAINHDAEALSMHSANHPHTVHLCGDIWHYAPRDVTQGKPVDLLWCSPTCSHFSKAKGGPLRDAKIRSLAWVAVRWARDAKPRVICLENVEEWVGWGRLTNEGRPDPRFKGETFRRWVAQLRKAGYAVEWRELRACDYGAPTTRKRLFVIARRDGEPIVWPTPSHGRGLLAYRSAAECIDFSLPCPSIFDRAKPLAEATLRRIARGIRKFVIESPKPFVIPVSHAGDERVHSVDEPLRTVTASSRSPFRIVVPTLIHRSNGERSGQDPRIYDIQEPLRTIVAGGVKQALVVAFLAKHYGGNYVGPGVAMDEPVSTITTVDHHHLVAVALGADRSADVEELLRRYMPERESAQLSFEASPIGDYCIVDIGTRLLTPRELFRAQGFDDTYRIDPPSTKTAQIRMVGNSVSPPVAAAIVRANVGADAATEAA